MIFGRSDLRIGFSRAKFDGAPDFEARLAFAVQKHIQFMKKKVFRTNVLPQFAFNVEKSNLGNRLKQALAKFLVDRGLV